MSEEGKQKTIRYFRARFTPSTASEFSVYLNAAHAATPNVADRTFRFDNQEVKCCHCQCDPQENRHYLHLTVTTPGEPASTVPNDGGVQQVDLKTCDAPRDAEFMNGDIMMMVQGDHVMFCSTGLKPSKATQYLRRLFKKTKQHPVAASVKLIPVADVNRLAIIRRKGVQSVSLAAGVYPATLSLLEREPTATRKIISKVWEEFSALTAADDDPQNVRENENLTTEVTFRFDRRRKGGELGMKRLEAFAERIIEEDDDEGFRITTFGGGESFTAQNITLKKLFTVPKDGETVNYQAVWLAMKEYMEELSAHGILDQ